MSKLNTNAANLVDKYIRQTSPYNMVDTRKRRGLQAEINKIDAIRKVILNSKIDDKELLRFRVELNKLVYVIDSQLVETKTT